jgi:hypothetical protein
MSKLVVIEDGTIFMMLNDPKFATEIPCLVGKRDVFRTSPGGCGACARKRSAQRHTELTRIKSCLAALSQEKRTVLKNLLDAETVRVVYTNSGGQVVQVNF